MFHRRLEIQDLPIIMSLLASGSSSTVVEYQPHHHKVNGLSLAGALKNCRVLDVHGYLLSKRLVETVFCNKLERLVQNNDV
jgi:hypothetical protein